MQADRVKGQREPQDNARRSHAAAAFRRDDGPGAYGYRPPGRLFLGGVIAQFDAGAKIAIAAKHHVPGEAGDLARA